jgi:pectinesterase
MMRRLTFAALASFFAAVSLFPAPPPPDITVAADGSGQFTTIQAALESLPLNRRERRVVLVRDGVYREKVRVDAHCVTLRGESRKGTRVEYPQLNDDFTAKPDRLGRAVVNIEGDDFVLENITVANTAGIVGPHSFAVFGKGDRTVILDSDVLSEGADTVSLWRAGGRYYHARCHFRGAVDFVCPRGWCYVVDCTFFETKATAAVWHDGHLERDMKFVLRNCRFDGVEGFNLGRHHADAQFYFLDCGFSKAMRDQDIRRVIYPIDGKPATDADRKRNADYDRTNLWGERSYFFNCHREGGDFAWFSDNLTQAGGKMEAAAITASWTFAGTWDPERRDRPAVRRIENSGTEIRLHFSEVMTVKGAPRLELASGKYADYVEGSGGMALLFIRPPGDTSPVVGIHMGAGGVLASEAGATLRMAEEKIR